MSKLRVSRPAARAGAFVLLVGAILTFQSHAARAWWTKSDEYETVVVDTVDSYESGPGTFDGGTYDGTASYGGTGYTEDNVGGYGTVTSNGMPYDLGAEGCGHEVSNVVQVYDYIITGGHDHHDRSFQAYITGSASLSLIGNQIAWGISSISIPGGGTPINLTTPGTATLNTKATLSGDSASPYFCHASATVIADGHVDTDPDYSVDTTTATASTTADWGDVDDWGR